MNYPSVLQSDQVEVVISDDFHAYNNFLILF